MLERSLHRAISAITLGIALCAGPLAATADTLDLPTSGAPASGSESTSGSSTQWLLGLGGIGALAFGIFGNSSGSGSTAAATSPGRDNPINGPGGAKVTGTTGGGANGTGTTGGSAPTAPNGTGGGTSTIGSGDTTSGSGGNVITITGPTGGATNGTNPLPGGDLTLLPPVTFHDGASDAVPEPSVFALGFSLLGFTAFTTRRRKNHV